MTDVAELGIRVQSAETKKGAADLDAIAKSAAGAEQAVNRTAGAVQRLDPPLRAVRQSIRLAGNGARQMAMQLSQAAQQGALTGNYLTALAYQVPDLGLRFGALGIGITAVAGIALPALVAVLTQADARTKALKEATDNLVQSTEKYRISAAAVQLGVSEEEVLIVQNLNAMLLQREGLQRQIAETIGRANIPLSLQLKTLNEQIAAAQALVGNFRNAKAAAEGITTAQENVAAAMRLAISMRYTEKDLIAAIQNGLAKAAAATRDTVSAGSAMSGVFASATGVASGLAATLWDAARAAWSIAQGRAAYEASGAATGLTGPDGVRAGQFGGSRVAPMPSGAGRAAPPSFGGGGGSSGGGGSDGYAERLEALRKELAGEQAVVDEWYANAQAVLADRRAQEILGEQGHRDALLEVERLYQQQLAEIQGKEQSARLEQAAGFFGALGGVMEAGGRKAAKAAAIAGGIQATINAYVAATEALRQPGLTLWGRLAAYASVLGTGLKAAAAVRAAGGAGGGGGGGAAPAAQGGGTSAQAPQQRLVIQGLRATDILTGQMIYDMFMGEGRLRGAPVVELMGR